VSGPSPKGNPLPEKLIVNLGKLGSLVQFSLHTEHRREAGCSVLSVSIQWHSGGRENSFDPPCYEIREVLGAQPTKIWRCPCGTVVALIAETASLLRDGMFARTKRRGSKNGSRD